MTNFVVVVVVVVLVVVVVNAYICRVSWGYEKLFERFIRGRELWKHCSRGLSGRPDVRLHSSWISELQEPISRPLKVFAAHPSAEICLTACFFRNSDPDIS
jgi:hypothetical protein